MCKQEHNESPEDYMHKLKAWADVVEHCGGDIAGSWKNIPEEFGTQEEREKAAMDYTSATAYIKGMDRTRYGVLSADLKNSYAKGQNDYPTDLATAFALLNSYETPKNEQVQNKVGHQHQRHEYNNRHSATKTEEGYTFVQNIAKKFVQKDPMLQLSSVWTLRWELQRTQHQGYYISMSWSGNDSNQQAKLQFHQQ